MTSDMTFGLFGNNTCGKALLYDSSLGKIIGISKQNCPGDACF